MQVRIDGLGVDSRTPWFAYMGRELSAADIAGELTVAHILEGSLRMSSNRVGITAQLFDTGRDRQLWSETFDRELTAIFAIQYEIGNAIVDALRDSLGEKAAAAVLVRADTENLQAYDLHLKAREMFSARSELPESVRLLERAVEFDSDFARRWEGLAAVNAGVQSWAIDDRDYNAMVRPAAERTLKPDPALSMASAALSMAEQDEASPDWASALALAGKAIEADSPGSKRVLEKCGVLGIWRAHYFPPQCRARGEADFECDDVTAAR